MEMKLPQVERIITETIDGKQVQKQIYADGSYGVRDGDSVERYFPDGKKQTYLKSADSFRLSKEVLPDGTEREWYSDGQMKSESLPDGTYHSWYDNGQMASEILSDGTYHSWYSDGQMSGERLPDGTYHSWYSDGQMEREELPDGTERKWYSNGQMESEKLPDGTYHSWYSNGQMKRERLPDGTETRYDDQGKMFYHATKGVEDTVLYVAKKHVAERRLQKEDKRSKGKRVILPKMNKLSKAIEMKKAVRKVKKDLGR